jgi:microcompartment protein CcmK/EutM
MILGIVTGTVVATEKHAQLAGRKILIVQPTDPSWKPKGKPVLAIDEAQAGVGDRVLVVDEGGSARLVLGDPGVTVIRTVVAGIVDSVDVGGVPA